MKESAEDKQKLLSLREWLVRALKKDPQMAKKAAQLIEDMLNKAKKSDKSK